MSKCSIAQKAVLYLRYSSAGQTEQSIEGQERVCRQYAKNHGIDIVDVYIDRAKSASKDIRKRTEFLRMIDDARQNGFDCVIVYKLDRFARDRFDSAFYKKELEKCGVGVISATESISDGPEGMIMESVLEAWAAYYSVDLAQKVRRGIEESKSKRKFLGGKVPFGLISKDGALEPDPERAPAVVLAFNLVLEGYSFTKIAEILTAKGYRTKEGNPIKTSTIRKILHNKKLCGYYVYEDLEIPGIYTPVVDPEVFEMVQEKINRDMKRRKKKVEQDSYLLSGKLFCGHCNHPMIGECGKSANGNFYHYYSCYGKKKLKNGCAKKNMRKDDIEQFVIDKAREQLTNERIKEIAEAVWMIVSEHQNEQDRLPALEAHLNEISKKIDNLTEAVANGLVTEAIIEKLKKEESERETIRLQIEHEKSISQSKITKADVISWLVMLKEKIIHDDRLLIETFIDRIDVYDDDNTKKPIQIKITYRLDSGSEMFDFYALWPTIRNLPLQITV